MATRIMTFDDYQLRAYPRRSAFDGSMSFWANGLGGEIGEVVEMLELMVKLTIAGAAVQNTCKKLDRDQPEDESVLKDRLLSEVGDVLFYLRQICEKKGISMNTVAAASILKLDAIGLTEVKP